MVLLVPWMNGKEKKRKFFIIEDVEGTGTHYHPVTQVHFGIFKFSITNDIRNAIGMQKTCKREVISS